MTGYAKLAMVVCLSPAPQNGWETWFACTYGEDLNKLRCPVVLPRGAPLETLQAQTAKALRDAEDALAKTPPSGAPSSKFYPKRCADCAELRQVVLQLEALKAQA